MPSHSHRPRARPQPRARLPAPRHRRLIAETAGHNALIPTVVAVRAVVRTDRSAFTRRHAARPRACGRADYIAALVVDMLAVAISELWCCDPGDLATDVRPGSTPDALPCSDPCREMPVCRLIARHASDAAAHGTFSPPRLEIARSSPERETAVPRHVVRWTATNSPGVEATMPRASPDAGIHSRTPTVGASWRGRRSATSTQRTNRALSACSPSRPGPDGTVPKAAPAYLPRFATEKTVPSTPQPPAARFAATAGRLSRAALAARSAKLPPRAVLLCPPRRRGAAEPESSLSAPFRPPASCRLCSPPAPRRARLLSRSCCGTAKRCNRAAIAIGPTEGRSPSRAQGWAKRHGSAPGAPAAVR